MNKTFKRVLASMLAILMIICSMPFTVFAAEMNRKWWIDDGIDPATITEEPVFTSYNCDDPDETWDLLFGEKVSWAERDYEDLRDEYKPVFGITVSDVGTNGADIDTLAAKYQNNYSASAARTFEAAKADGTIINPANLKAGQRIAITFEMGGVDLINNAQVLGSYDSNYIIPGYYSGKPTPKKGDTWMTTTTGSSPWKTPNAIYSAQGDAIAFAASAVTANKWQTGVNGTANQNGEVLVSNYIGRNNEERGFDSGYGLVMGTVFFEVLQDCDLKDVFVPSERPDGCIMEPVARNNTHIQADKLWNVTVGDYDHAFANAPIIWTAYEKNETPSCTHANTTETKEVTTAATCETAGVETVTVTCNDCGEVVSTSTNEIAALGHSYTGALAPAGATQHTVACVNGCGTTETVDCTFTVVDHKDATVTEEGYDKYACACGNTYTTVIDKLTCEHNNTTESKEVTKAATCTETGVEVVTVTCNDCGKVVSTTENTIAMIPHTEKVVPGKAATCTATGLTDGKVCEVCDTVLVEQTVIDMIPHTEVEIPAVAATCTDGGKTAGVKCSVCDTIITAPQDTEALGHDYVEVPGSAVAPTVDAEGKKADQKCTRCDDVIVGEAIPALASYLITVEATDLGTVTLNGADVTNGAAVKVEAGSTVTLTAEAVEGAKFLGWTANGLTTVSTDTTFTTVALANVTYAPVFEKAVAEDFTVVFADSFGNIVSTQHVTSGADIVIPEAPARSGYVAATENGWTMTNEEIKALTSAATIIAVYELAESEGFTVTANGATITVDGTETADVATGIAYDTLVTVYKEGAKGWSVNGVTVAYGDTYSFYVGKDIEVVAVMDAVTAVPMVANVGVNEVGTTGRIQAQFIATRTMADGYTYIDSGFVYGKGDLGEITLFDVDGSAVKAAYTKTASEQFSVTYGLSAQTGTVTARAFIAYANADGEVTVAYAAPMTYTY